MYVYQSHGYVILKQSQIIFGGDSAGGHLSLSLLSHLHRPRPVEEDENSGHLYPPITLDSPVKGCFLVSPLTSLNLTTRSFKERFSVDILSKKIVSRYGEHLIHRSPWHREMLEGHGWGMALDVPETWWEGLDVVDRVLVTAGWEEVFRDHVVQLANVLRRKTRVKQLEWLMAVDEAHDAPLVDFLGKAKPPSTSTDKITEWVIRCFSD